MYPYVAITSPNLESLRDLEVGTGGPTPSPISDTILMNRARDSCGSDSVWPPGMAKRVFEIKVAIYTRTLYSSSIPSSQKHVGMYDWSNIFPKKRRRGNIRLFMSAQIEFFTASQLLFWILFLFPLRRASSWSIPRVTQQSKPKIRVYYPKPDHTTVF